MPEMRSQITITTKLLPQPLVVPVCNSVRIEAKRKQIEETAVVRIPHTRTRFNFLTLEPGAGIKVELGYDDQLQTEYEGVVTSAVDLDDVVELKCEGAITYAMKHTKVKPEAWESVSLQTVVKHCLKGFETEIKIQNATLSDFRIEEITAYEAIVELKKYGFDVFERTLSKKLFCCVPFTDSEAIAAGVARYEFGTERANAIKRGKSLEFIKAEEVKLRLRGISKYIEDGKTKTRTYEAGDKDGGVHTIHYYNKTTDELKELIDTLLKDYKYDGLSGFFFAFWRPQIKLCQTISMVDARDGFSGNYFAEGITTLYNGSNGYKRMIFPGHQSK